MSIWSRRSAPAEVDTLDPALASLLRNHFSMPSAVVNRVGGRRSKGVHLDFVDLIDEDKHHHIVAKRYLDGEPNPRLNRPGLGLVDDRAAKPTTEWAGLVLLHERLPESSVEPLLNVADDQLLVMERFRGPGVRATLLADPDVAFDQLVTAARLLATLHELPGGAPLRATAAEVAEAGRELIAFTQPLLRPIGLGRVSGWWASQTDRDPMIGLGHGDCAPRNFVSDLDGRVAIIDCLARHRCPVLEDVATFTTSVRILLRTQQVRRAQLARHGQRMAEAFATGYHAHAGTDPVDLGHFEGLVLLDRLASLKLRKRTPATIAQVALVVDELRRVLKETS